ncbi:hypothetical protein ACP70R_006722 [Stipagrostis hirtigluma subsp. patula]
MAEPDAPSSHHVIDIGDVEPSCCAVCMEPPEWVAVGPCGHRDVCLDCAIRMRFLGDDRRCCICRAFCPIVLIMRAGDLDGGQQHQQAAALSTPPPAFGGAGPGPGRPGGVYCWYHAGMAAYFDDRRQYKAVRKMCLELKPLPRLQPRPPVVAPPPAPGASPESPRFSFFLLYLVVGTLLGAATGVPIAIGLKHWLARVAAVLACALAFAAFGYVTWPWHSDTSPEDRQGHRITPSWGLFG